MGGYGYVFVCWNKTRKTVLHLLCWKGSKPPARCVSHTLEECGIPHTHFKFSVWYLVPHTLSLEFQRVCGTLEIRVCWTIIWSDLDQDNHHKEFVGSFDLNFVYSSCWGYSLINTLKLKKGILRELNSCELGVFRFWCCSFLLLRLLLNKHS